MKGSEFREIRQQFDMTQEEFAVLLGLSGKISVSNIERGVRNPGKLMGIVLRVLSSLPEAQAREFMALMLKQGKKKS